MTQKNVQNFTPDTKTSFNVNMGETGEIGKRKLILNNESRREKMKDNEIGEIKESPSLKMDGKVWGDGCCCRRGKKKLIQHLPGLLCLMYKSRCTFTPLQNQLYPAIAGFFTLMASAGVSKI